MMIGESEKNNAEIHPTRDVGMALLLSGLQSPGALTALYAGGQAFMTAWESSNLMSCKAASPE